MFDFREHCDAADMHPHSLGLAWFIFFTVFWFWNFVGCASVCERASLDAQKLGEYSRVSSENFSNFSL